MQKKQENVSLTLRLDRFVNSSVCPKKSWPYQRINSSKNKQESSQIIDLDCKFYDYSNRYKHACLFDQFTRKSSKPHFSLIFYNNRLQLMSSLRSKENLSSNIQQLLKTKDPQSPKKTILRRNVQRLLKNDVLFAQTPLSVSEHSLRIIRETKWIRSFYMEIHSKPYTFDKILPIQRICDTQLGPRISYLIPSEIFTIFSPLFLNGLAEYLQTHEKYQEQKSEYIKSHGSKDLLGKQKFSNPQACEHKQMAPYSEEQEDFYAYFLKKYRNDKSLTEFIGSLLMFNYFNILDMAKNPGIRHLTEKSKRGKYSSFFELYKDSTEQLQKIVISKMIGSQCELGRYSQFLETQRVQTPFCIKYEDQYVAILYTIRLNEHEYKEKIKNKALLTDLKEKGNQEIIYISTLYVLPKYKGLGHGRNILNILKDEGIVLVLCSSATSQQSGLQDNIGTGNFYRKCQFQEYYPLQASLDCEGDKGCLLQSDKHKDCEPHNCKYPLAAYYDESYYVYYPQASI